MIEQRDAEILEGKSLVAQRDAEILESKSLVAQRDAEILESQSLVAERDADILESQSVIAIKDAEIARLRGVIADVANTFEETLSVLGVSQLDEELKEEPEDQLIRLSKHASELAQNGLLYCKTEKSEQETSCGDP